MLEHFIWAERYRPKTLDECIFPARLYDTFAGWIEKKQIPDTILFGPPGTGKTTVAKVVVEAIGSEWFKINGSLNGNKDTLRTDIFQFASTVAIGGEGKKYVIIDEADGLTHDTQKALRGFMDEYTHNCGFIFTANYPARIIEPIDSRSQKQNFNVSKAERPDLMERTYKKMVKILRAEAVGFDAKVLSQIVVDHFPDIRATINQLQLLATRDGEVTRIESMPFDAEISSVVNMMKGRDFPGIRKWAAETHIEFHTLAKALFDKAPEFVNNDSLATLIILLGEYQHKAALVIDQEINIAAFLAQAMSEVEFR